jgi:predicted HicB family RNase H-like nuclease
MKHAFLVLLGCATLVAYSPMVSAITDTTSSTTDAAYYEEKKLLEQKRSTEMRLEYYNKYKAKGYDVSMLDAYLDGAKTTESDFWYVLKKVQNNHEVPQRREYITKLKNYGYDVSGFSETVIWDSGKFWELVKIVEAGKKPVSEVKKETEKKVEEKKIEEKKEEPKYKTEEKKTDSTAKLNQKQAEQLKILMKARIAKIPATSREATLTRLETALVKAIA